MTQLEFMQEQAKIKAEELYEIFHQNVEITHCYSDGIIGTARGHLMSDYAKQFAKKAVHEIIKTKEPDAWMGVGFDNDPKYWEEVIRQIDKL